MTAFRLLLACLFAASLLTAQDAPKEGKEERIKKRLRLADQLESQGDEDGALQILEDLAEKNPDDQGLLRRIATLQLKNGRAKEAIPHLRKMLDLGGGKDVEYVALARLMIEVKEFEEAVALLEEGAKRYPEAAEFPFLLTYPLSFLERWKEAIAQFEKTLALAKDEDAGATDSAFHFRYASALERSGDLGKAVPLFRKTLDLIEQEASDEDAAGFKATVLNYLAYLWIERNENLDEAGKMALEAAELDPESGAIADTVGWFHFQKGNYPRALAELKKAERLIPEPDPVILDHIGQTLSKLKEAEFATEYFQKALELDPGNAEIKKRLEALKP